MKASPIYDQAIEHLSGPNGEPHPVIKMAIKYWWLSLPVAMAMYGKYRERIKEDNEYKFYNFFSDFGSVVGPLMTFVGLSEVARRLEMEGKLAPAAKVKDAEFTMQPQVEQNATENPTVYQPEST